MSIYEMSLDLKKSSPIYSDPIVLRQGDTNVEILVHVFDNSTPKNLENLHIEFHADKPDATTIDDDEQSHFTIGTDKESFTYTVPDELTDASGSTTNTYFKVGSDSTSNFYIHILTKAGMEKIESGDYISKVDRIFNHVMSDYTAINDLAETGKGTFDTALADSKKEIKDLMDNLNAEYVQFINSKTTDFNTFLANLDSQATDVKTKYTALKTQLDALEVPEIGGRNYALDTGVPRTIGPSNSWQELFSPKLSENLNGQDLVISFDLMVDAATDGQLLDQTNEATNPSWFSATVSNNQIQGIKQSGSIQLSTLTPNTPVRFAYKFKMPVWADTKQSGYVTIGLGAGSIVGGNVTISKLKIEKGTVATDWTPAPEDKANVSDTNDLQNKYTALQTQVDYSAVGTNLLVGTGNNLSITGTNISNQTTNDYLLTNGYNISTLVSAFGTQFTISYDWSVSGSSPSGTFNAIWNDFPWGDGRNMAVLNTISSSNTSGHISNTFNLSADSKNIATGIHFRLDSFVGTLTISNIKLEKGNFVTDWCPNPSEILTQSNYAKIKAAIVALGGSLS